MKIVISKDGKSIRFIYKDELLDLMDEGHPSVERASNVEPVEWDGKIWWKATVHGADCDYVLDAFKTREEALAAEVEWLEKHGIPSVSKC